MGRSPSAAGRLRLAFPVALRPLCCSRRRCRTVIAILYVDHWGRRAAHREGRRRSPRPSRGTPPSITLPRNCEESQNLERFQAGSSAI
jgi:hypothetical protein